ncbi:hypothetical protein GF362_00075 [Candidatus Dojkabacteria bacterium]|nr:hypothetical protein [Candidatus Dojkabacteria bacterium]
MNKLLKPAEQDEIKNILKALFYHFGDELENLDYMIFQPLHNDSIHKGQELKEFDFYDINIYKKRGHEHKTGYIINYSKRKTLRFFIQNKFFILEEPFTRIFGSYIPTELHKKDLKIIGQYYYNTSAGIISLYLDIESENKALNFWRDKIYPVSLTVAKINRKKVISYKDSFELLFQKTQDGLERKYEISTRTGSINISFNIHNEIFKYQKANQPEILFNFSKSKSKKIKSKNSLLLNKLFHEPDNQVELTKKESSSLQRIKEKLYRGDSKTTPPESTIPKEIVDKMFNRTRKWGRLNIEGFIDTK